MEENEISSHAESGALSLLTEKFNIKEFENLLSDYPKYRSRQIYDWILSGADSFEQMTNIPKKLKDELKTRFKIFSGNVASCHEDKNTKKIVIQYGDGVKTEAVLLRDKKNRFTACISTQAGCPCGCVFCKTGTLKFKRNLESSEIIEQYLRLINICKNNYFDNIETQQNKKEHLIGNIVIMGMGEPLLNLINLRKAIDVFTDPAGINLSKRRITVSTCGIFKGLFDFADNGPFVKLALSLTTADEKLRASLMPITEFNSLLKIKEALLLYQKNGGGRVTLEIPLLGGINTRAKDASSIRDFAKGLSSVINIIPWNPVSGLEFNGAPLREPEKDEADNFKKKLEDFNFKVTMRLHKGRKVLGACGQLGSTD